MSPTLKPQASSSPRTWPPSAWFAAITGRSGRGLSLRDQLDSLGDDGGILTAFVGRLRALVIDAGDGKRSLTRRASTVK
jgi:hypothetical protein